MRPTLEQAAVLARIERAHGRVHRIPDTEVAGQRMLEQCEPGARAYHCLNCERSFTIDTDGQCRVWKWRAGSGGGR